MTALLLRSQSPDEVKPALAILFAGYPEPFTAQTAQLAQELNNARVKAYLIGLEGLPLWAVERAVTEFIQGRVERRRRGVLPTAEELAAQARVHLNAESDKQRRRAEVDAILQERKEEAAADAYRKTPEGMAELARRRAVADRVMANSGFRNMEA